MERLKKMTRKHFPKIGSEKLRNLTINIYMVVIGVKPSFLIDTIAVRNYLPHFISLLQEIKVTSNIFEETILRIVSIQDDYFIVNVEKSLARVPRDRQYVDVSSSLKMPVLISHSASVSFCYRRNFTGKPSISNNQ